MIALSQKIKAEISLRQLAESYGVIWDLRKSRTARGDYWAACPFHGEKTSSFHLVEPEGVGGWFRCFGCEAKGSAVDFHMNAHGGSAREAMRDLADGAGITWQESPERKAERESRLKAQTVRAFAQAAREARRNLQRARRIWSKSLPGNDPRAGTLLAYLNARGIDLDALCGVPGTIRYHPALRYALPDGSAAYGPAMVAAIGTAGDFRGVHRTWITPIGRACFPNGTKIPKQWLGETGRVFGAPVRLSPISDCVIVGEGIETTLAVMAAMWRKGRRHWSAEAALSLGALAGPADPAGRGPERGTNGEPLPSAIPAKTNAPGWLPGSRPRRLLILGEGSSRCPASAERHGRRALNKLKPHADRIKLRVPHNDWSADLDFADLAQMEEI